MKVLITGGTGLIGKELITKALSLSYSIHYLTTSKKKIVCQKNYKGFYWNPAKGNYRYRLFAWSRGYYPFGRSIYC